MRSFLWGGSNGRGYAKVGWDKVCSRKEEGGLGIIPLLAQNKALMVKNIWILLTHSGSSGWVQWVRRYKLNGASFWSIAIPKSCSWSWKQMLKLRPFIRHAFDYKIGNGRTFLLWRDPWHEEGILGERYPHGPSFTLTQWTDCVAEVIREGEWEWPGIYNLDIHFIVANLPHIFRDQEDQIIWRLHSSGNFTTRSALSLFIDTKPKVPWATLLHGPGKIPRNNFILWLALHERLPLREKPWIGHGEIHCVLCGNGEIETHDHLFFKCEFSRKCVRYLKGRVKFQWPREEWARGVEWAAIRWRGKHKVANSYRILLAALVHGIWKERNTRIFEQTSMDYEAVVVRILKLAQDRIHMFCLDDSLQSCAVRRLWHVAW